jgi:hypothetical protein
MKSTKYIIYFLLLILIFVSNSYSQFQDDEFDKCGYDSAMAKSYLKALGDHWGYNYDSLLVDLVKWSESPYITIDSLGASVQNRAIWQLTITSVDTAHPDKQTVFMHARTHPGEIQSWWVTEQVIDQLTSESEFAKIMRENCLFYIIPMYNPDGVELEYPRENANEVDIESNWDAITVEPEVDVLRARFSELMTSDAPIKVAMNMHSAYGKHRYFIYHSSLGTSNEYAILEENYIEGVRFYYLNGIEPWYYKITWTTGTPTYYPESWFWLNYQEAVMALTYEDWNDPEAFNFDSTANAMLRGIADYLDINTASIVKNQTIMTKFDLFQNYPNPFNPSTNIEFKLNKAAKVELSVFDIYGKKVAELLNEPRPSGRHKIIFDASGLATGVYFYQLKTGNTLKNKQMLLIK